MTLVGLTDVDQLLGERRDAARTELAELIRTLTDAPGRAPLPTSACFEPRLYNQLGQPGFDEMSLDQLVLSRTAGPDGPLTAVADASGVIVFPGLGRCTTDLRGPVPVRYIEAEQALAAPPDGPTERRYPLESSTFVPGTHIEMVEHVDPILAGFLGHHIEAAEELVLVDPREHVPAVSRALQLLAAVRPVFHAALVESLRAILLYRHPTAESFTALAMHGMIFLNVPRRTGLSWYVEELTHQGGHVLFSEATLNRPDLFQVDPDSPFSTFVGPAEIRAVYDAFHGLYTEHMEFQVFRGILHAGLVEDTDEREFREHLESVATAHRRDLELFAPHVKDIFTARGEAVYSCFRESYEKATSE